MVLETWVPGTHTSAEKKIEIEAKSKKLSTFPSFHNSRETYWYSPGVVYWSGPPAVLVALLVLWYGT
jgi:hypothetical protein